MGYLRWSLILFLFAQVSFSSNVRIEPEHTYTRKNERFSIGIVCDNLPGLIGAELKLFYSPDKLEVETISAGSLFDDPRDIFLYGTETGYISIAGAKWENLEFGTGTIGTVSFLYLADYPEGSITLSEVVLVGTSGNIPVEKIINGYIHPYPPSSITLTAPFSINADSGTAGITGTITDKNNNLLDNIILYWTSTKGTLTPSTSTTKNGIATTTITGLTKPETITVTGTVNTLIATTTITITTGNPATITLTAPFSINADSGTAEITGTITDKNNNLLDNIILYWTSTKGTLTPSTSTTKNGIATTTITGLTKPETITVIATVNTLIATTTITITTGSPATITLFSPFPINADSGTAEITGTITDKNNNLLDNIILYWTSTKGTLTPSTSTTKNGITTTTITGLTKPEIITVIATVNTLIATTTITITTGNPATITLTAPFSINADSGTAGITGTITDKNNNLLDNIIVYWTSTKGTLTPSTSTTKNGIATTTITGLTKPETITVIATVNTLIATTTITITTGNPATITLFSPFPINADNAVGTITAYATDKNNNPVTNGTIIHWKTTYGILPLSTSTTTNGTATAIIQGLTKQGFYTITGSISETIKATTTITILAGNPATIDLTAPTTISADIGTAAILAYVTDKEGNPANTIINWTTTQGILTPATSSTQNGTATTILTNNNAGTCTITATVTSTLIATKTITITTGNLATITLTTPPTFFYGLTSTITITAYDKYGSIATTYNGTVSLFLDKGNLIPNSIFLQNGSKTFEVTIYGERNLILTAKDDGKVGTIGIFVIPPCSYFKISTPFPFSYRLTSTITITAYDKYGSIATTYNGTVTLSLNKGTITPVSITGFKNGSITTHISIFGERNVILIVKDSEGREGSITIFVIPQGFTTSLENVKVYPNPWRVDREEKRPYIVFEIPDGSHISIYTISGRLIKEFFDVLGPIHWGLDNCENKPISSGMYIYEVKDKDGKRKIGKLGIMR